MGESVTTHSYRSNNSNSVVIVQGIRQDFAGGHCNPEIMSRVSHIKLALQEVRYA